MELQEAESGVAVLRAAVGSRRHKEILDREYEVSVLCKMLMFRDPMHSRVAVMNNTYCILEIF